MTNVDGLGDAGDAEIHAFSAEVDPQLEARIAEGEEQAKRTYLEEARLNVKKAATKLEKARRELADAEANVETVAQELAQLEGGN